MTRYHDKPPAKKRVSEPVQVYLTEAEMSRLNWLTKEIGTNKSDVIRRALDTLELQLTDPRMHPALSIIGIATAETVEPDGIDAAVEHDRVLADAEEESWTADPGAP